MQLRKSIVFLKKKNVPRKTILVHIWLPILFNAFDNVKLYHLIVKRPLIPVFQIRVRNVKLVLLISAKTYVVGN